MFNQSPTMFGSAMATEYKIKFAVPANYNPAGLFEQMPCPIHRKSMSEIYNFKIEKEGFYFIDQAVDRRVAAEAFRLFVDEALRHGKSVEITKLVLCFVDRVVRSAAKLQLL